MDESEARIEALLATGRFVDRAAVIAAGVAVLHAREFTRRRAWRWPARNAEQAVALLYVAGLVAALVALATGTMRNTIR